MDGRPIASLRGEGQAKGRERGSKFLSFAYPVCSGEQAEEIVKALRKKYYDASHVCFAYRVGEKGEPWRASDDREPSGTAGRPILGQIQSMTLTDALVVVVRWFGGTKLGTPGLIAAYRQSARAALEDALSGSVK